MTILTRLHLMPPGIKKADGSWGLLKASKDSNYIDFLANYAKSTMNTSKHNSVTVDIWERITSKETGKYLLSRHPRLQFTDFTGPCGLTLLTHIQATGIEHKKWVGISRAGSTHFSIKEALRRTVSETLERTFLSELDTPLDIIWGSAVAPTPELAKELAIKEYMERWITYNAWSKKIGFSIQEIILQNLNNFKSILFEWERYNAKINFFLIKNPYELFVILVKIEVDISNNNFVFFSNGIGDDLDQVIEKALLETIQFIPGKNPNAWLKTLNDSKDCVLQGWQTAQLDVELPCVDSTTTSEIEFNSKYSLQHEVHMHTCDDCPGIFFGYVSLPKQKGWSTYKGIPIA